MAKTLQQIKDEELDRFITNEEMDRVIDQVAIRYAQEQNKHLLDWKESASKILNNIDLQKLGKLLGMQYGTAIDEQLLPAVTKLVDQKRELVEMLETVIHNSDVPHEIYDQSKIVITKHKQS